MLCNQVIIYVDFYACVKLPNVVNIHVHVHLLPLNYIYTNYMCVLVFYSTENKELNASYCVLLVF